MFKFFLFRLTIWKHNLISFIQTALLRVMVIHDWVAYNPVRAMARIALEDTVDYIRKNMPEAIAVSSKRQLYDFALSHVGSGGHFMEFGVFKGTTIRIFARLAPKQMIYGFDSFEGLPEAWGGFDRTKDAFNLNSRLPKVPRNVQLIAGWFENTLPEWLEQHDGAVSFLHIDCDLYSSTKTIFDLLGERIQPGTIIIFDEYFNYPNWQAHEFKAFQGFVKDRQVEYEYLAYLRYQVVIKVIAIG